jgi:RimJ/RimL family protein N-acetyltransferase
MSREANTVLVDNRQVLIRPIRADDTALEGDFVRNLSAQTKHYRFFGALKELSAAELKRLCSTDGSHSMAFIATVAEGGAEVEIGVCRYAPDSKEDVREMAVTIADAWQHTELAGLLMDRLIVAARQHGIRRLYSLELADNQSMRELAANFGMVHERDPGDASQVVYSLSL